MSQLSQTEQENREFLDQLKDRKPVVLNGNVYGEILIADTHGIYIALDVPGFDTTPGTGIQLWPSNRGDNQLWGLSPDSSDQGYYFIVNKHSGLVLDVPAGSTDNNVQVMQWRFQRNDSQKWAIYDSGKTILSAKLYWIFNKQSRKLLDSRGGLPYRNGSAVIQATPDASRSQTWVIRQ